MDDSEKFICEGCGEEIGDPRYMAGGFCFGCRLDAWIPPDYAELELYTYDIIWGHANATRRPPLGIRFLDEQRMTTAEMLIRAKTRPRF